MKLREKNLLKRKEENLRQAQNKNALVKPRSKYIADSNACDNFLDIYILLLKGKKQPLADILFRCSFFSDVL